jgi:hypothetical protein
MDASFGNSTHAQPASRLPFSFVYGTASSSSLLGGWKRTASEAAADLGNNTERRIKWREPLWPGPGLEVNCHITLHAGTAGVEWFPGLLTQGVPVGSHKTPLHPSRTPGTLSASPD